VISALLFAGLQAVLPQPNFKAQMFDQYVKERVAYRLGGVFYCDPPGQDRLFANVGKSLLAIRVALTSQFGKEAVATADARVDPEFEDVSGALSIAGCRTNDPVFDRANLRALKAKHDEALNALESALGLSKKGRR